MKWLLKSNRWKHLVGVFAVSLVGTILMGVGCIAGMEFKDVHHYNGDHVPLRKWDWSPWDWLDCLAGLLGGLMATVIHIFIFFIVR